MCYSTSSSKKSLNEPSILTTIPPSVVRINNNNKSIIICLFRHNSDYDKGFLDYLQNV